MSNSPLTGKLYTPIIGNLYIPIKGFYVHDKNHKPILVRNIKFPLMLIDITHSKINPSDFALCYTLLFNKQIVKFSPNYFFYWFFKDFK